MASSYRERIRFGRIIIMEVWVGVGSGGKPFVYFDTKEGVKN